MYQAMLVQHGMFGGPMYPQNPVLIEDALGWKFSLPLEIARSWEVMYSQLIDIPPHVSDLT